MSIVFTITLRTPLGLFGHPVNSEFTGSGWWHTSLLSTGLSLCEVRESKSVLAELLTDVIQFWNDVMARGARLAGLPAHGRDCVCGIWTPHVNNSGQEQPHEDHVRSEVHDASLV